MPHQRTSSGDKEKIKPFSSPAHLPVTTAPPWQSHPMQRQMEGFSHEGQPLYLINSLPGRLKHPASFFFFLLQIYEPFKTLLLHEAFPSPDRAAASSQGLLTGTSIVHTPQPAAFTHLSTLACHHFLSPWLGLYHLPHLLPTSAAVILSTGSAPLESRGLACVQSIK